MNEPIRPEKKARPPVPSAKLGGVMPRRRAASQPGSKVEPLQNPHLLRHLKPVAVSPTPARNQMKNPTHSRSLESEVPMCPHWRQQPLITLDPRLGTDVPLSILLPKCLLKVIKRRTGLALLLTHKQIRSHDLPFCFIV